LTEEDDEDAYLVKKVDKNIKLEQIDLPAIYHYLDEDFYDFFEALANTNKIKYFNNRVIQSMVEFNFPLVRKFMLAFLITPFIIFHLTFVLYMNLVYESREEEGYENYNFYIGLFLIAVAVYFLLIEAVQLKNQKLGYLISIWNYIDIISPLGVITI